MNKYAIVFREAGILANQKSIQYIVHSDSGRRIAGVGWEDRSEWFFRWSVSWGLFYVQKKVVHPWPVLFLRVIGVTFGLAMFTGLRE